MTGTSSKSMFGFTNDDADFAQVVAWYNTAVADGWRAQPTYQSEPMQRAAKLHHPEGYIANILMRSEATGRKPGKWKYEAQVCIWGPDGLVIRPAFPYAMDDVRAGTRICNACGATDVDTQRYSFAGRCCVACRPEMARQTEQPGWTD